MLKNLRKSSLSFKQNPDSSQILPFISMVVLRKKSSWKFALVYSSIDRPLIINPALAGLTNPRV